ncbi:MAG: acyl carrier protein [Rhodocyclales bacterium]|nr:acyl carrier protein [Rhodocyclales bacterium]
MDNQAIYDRLTEIFHDVFDDDSIVVTPELTASDIDEWDSLTHIRLVVSIERSFHLKFSAAEVGRLKNVGEFVELIRMKAAA